MKKSIPRSVGKGLNVRLLDAVAIGSALHVLVGRTFAYAWDRRDVVHAVLRNGTWTLLGEPRPAPKEVPYGTPEHYTPAPHRHHLVLRARGELLWYDGYRGIVEVLEEDGSARETLELPSGMVHVAGGPLGLMASGAYADGPFAQRPRVMLLPRGASEWLDLPTLDPRASTRALGTTPGRLWMSGSRDGKPVLGFHDGRSFREVPTVEDSWLRVEPLPDGRVRILGRKVVLEGDPLGDLALRPGAGVRTLADTWVGDRHLVVVESGLAEVVDGDLHTFDLEPLARAMGMHPSKTPWSAPESVRPLPTGSYPPFPTQRVTTYVEGVVLFDLANRPRVVSRDLEDLGSDGQGGRLVGLPTGQEMAGIVVECAPLKKRQRFAILDVPTGQVFVGSTTGMHLAPGEGGEGSFIEIPVGSYRVALARAEPGDDQEPGSYVFTLEPIGTDWPRPGPSPLLKSHRS